MNTATYLPHKPQSNLLNYDDPFIYVARFYADVDTHGKTLAELEALLRFRIAPMFADYRAPFVDACAKQLAKRHPLDVRITLSPYSWVIRCLNRCLNHKFHLSLEANGPADAHAYALKHYKEHVMHELNTLANRDL